MKMSRGFSSIGWVECVSVVNPLTCVQFLLIKKIKIKKEIWKYDNTPRIGSLELIKNGAYHILMLIITVK